MKYTLRIQLSSIEGSVIRTLGLIERRGFSLIKCSVGEADGNGRVMEVKVASSRPGDLLKRQLERLHDVLSVELVTVISIKQEKPGLRPIRGRV